MCHGAWNVGRRKRKGGCGAENVRPTGRTPRGWGFRKQKPAAHDGPPAEGSGVSYRVVEASFHHADAVGYWK
jgi:hypothetical protein